MCVFGGSKDINNKLGMIWAKLSTTLDNFKEPKNMRSDLKHPIFIGESFCAIKNRKFAKKQSSIYSVLKELE